MWVVVTGVDGRDRFCDVTGVGAVTGVGDVTGVLM